MAKKSPQSAVEQRISDVFRLMIRCTPHYVIHRYCADKWGISGRQADVYISRAKALMMERYLNQNRDEIWAEEMACRADLYARAYEDKKWGMCLEIARDRSKLRRLYQRDVAALDALAVLANEGLASPEQMKVVVDGINSIQEKLRSLSKASE